MIETSSAELRLPPADSTFPREPRRKCRPRLLSREEAMPVEVTKRDYSLIGRDTKAAQENGLAAAQWYACPIPRKELKALMKRSDGPAIRDTIIWFGAMGISGYLGYLFWGTLWAVPFFLIYG